MADSVLPSDARLAELADRVTRARKRVLKKKKNGTVAELKEAAEEFVEAQEELKAYMQAQRRPTG